MPYTHGVIYNLLGEYCVIRHVVKRTMIAGIPEADVKAHQANHLTTYFCAKSDNDAVARGIRCAQSYKAIETP